MTTAADAFWRNETSLPAALWSVKADVLWAIALLTLAFEVGPVHWAMESLVEMTFGELGEIPEGTEMGLAYWTLTTAIATIGLYYTGKGVYAFLARRGARQEVNVANVENRTAFGAFRIPVAFVTKVEKSWGPFGSTISITWKGQEKPFKIFGARKADAAIGAIKNLNKLI